MASYTVYFLPPTLISIKKFNQSYGSNIQNCQPDCSITFSILRYNQLLIQLYHIDVSHLDITLNLSINFIMHHPKFYLAPKYNIFVITVLCISYKRHIGIVSEYSVSFQLYSIQFSTFLMDSHLLFYDQLISPGSNHYHLINEYQNGFLCNITSNQLMILLLD